MSKEIETNILENTFVDRLRLELVIDLLEYERLCDDLRLLAKEWRSVSMVRKDIVQNLYVLAPITQAMASHVQDQEYEVEQMAVVIDALVIDCLYTGTEFDQSRLDKLLDI